MAEKIKEVEKYLCKVVLYSRNFNRLIMSIIYDAALHNLLLSIKKFMESFT